jgi:hypothetical protein
LSYIRSKRIRGYGPYFYEQEGHRGPDGKVHTKHIRYLGKDPHSGRNSGGHTPEPQEHRSSDVSNTPQDAGPDAGQPSPPDQEQELDSAQRSAGVRSPDELQETEAKQEAQRNIIDDTQAPQYKKDRAKRKRTGGLDIQIGGF